MIGLKILPAIVCLSLASILAISQQSQKIKATVIGDEVIIEGPGIWRRIVLAEGHKENLLLSPKANKLIYHDKFDPYKPPPLPKPVTTFTVVDLSMEKVLHLIPLYWQTGRRGRFLYAVEWIDNRYFSVLGEGSLAVLDTENGRQMHNLWGSRFSLAPDRRKIVFVHGTPLIYLQHPEKYESFLSDYVMLAFIDRGQPLDENNLSSNLTAMTIYPEIFPPGKMEEKTFRDLDERHFIKSGFSWSPDSQSVAFVEDHRQAFWLVILHIDANERDVKAVAKRFELADKLPEVTGLEWAMDGQAVKVITSEASYLVDLAKGEVKPQLK